jgi:hypothetical protein
MRNLRCTARWAGVWLSHVCTRTHLTLNMHVGGCDFKECEKDPRANGCTIEAMVAIPVCNCKAHSYWDKQAGKCMGRLDPGFQVTNHQACR